MYPFNLELQYKKDFAGRFAKYAKPFTQEVIARLRSEHRADSDVSVRVDSLEDMLEYIRKLREKYGERIEAEKLEKIIKKDFTQIDAWARDKSNEVMGKMYSRLNTPQPPSVTGRPTPKGQAGELWMTTVKPFNNLSQPNKDLIDEAVKRNVHLINEKYKAHFDDIERIVKENILSGKSRKEIAKELMETTGVNISQAEFWARDQSSKFFGEATRIRQQGAGIPGYIWRCVGDNKTRDRHSDLEGTYHKWGNPPIVDLLSGRKADPGGDYNCRCHAEPALGPEMADREYTDPKPDDNYYENIRPGTEKAGFTGTKQSQNIAYVDQKSIKDINKYVTGNLADTANFNGIQNQHVGRANEWCRALANSINNFPKIREYLLFTGTCQEHVKFGVKQGFRKRRIDSSTIALAFTHPKIKGISINKSFINDPRLSERLNRGVDIKFHPVGCNTIKAQVDHEIGHILTKLLGLDKDKVIKNLWDGYKKDFNRLTEDLSEYSWNNKNKNPIYEFISEAWSEYENNPNCRPLAKEIGKRIKYLYSLLGG